MMSTGIESNSPDAEGLQFDQAEFAPAEAPASVACSNCKRPIDGSYYAINGSIVCEDCRVLIERHLTGGSKLGRFVRALIFGSAAAVVGAAIYFSVIHFAHLEAGLVSILCGFLVGKAVRAGTNNRGGWVYQVMAIGLTYLAIGAAYAVHQIVSDPEVVQLIQKARADGNMPAMIASLAVGVVLWTVIIPVLVARNSILSMAIMAFAIWEAWKLTRRARVVIAGPYRAAGSAAIEDPAGEATDGDR